MITEAQLQNDAVILDPWNGSGTSTYAASHAGFKAVGIDINPVMVVVAKARHLRPSEADSLIPLYKEILAIAKDDTLPIDKGDALRSWFQCKTARIIRALERSVCRLLISEATCNDGDCRWEDVSSLASIFYVCLFRMCRQLLAPMRTSNPTWTKRPKAEETKIGVDIDTIFSLLAAEVGSVSLTMKSQQGRVASIVHEPSVRLADIVSDQLEQSSYDMLITSPPYCTRIDYAEATGVELALVTKNADSLRHQLRTRMLGTTRAEKIEIQPEDSWGGRCKMFLEQVANHPSKASSTYYYKVHLDYYNKLFLSLENAFNALVNDGQAVIVAQDSFYKDLHNDLPSIIIDMACNLGMHLMERTDFRNLRSMSDINPGAAGFRRKLVRHESVLSFVK